jgi:hypothetical protein
MRDQRRKISDPDSDQMETDDNILFFFELKLPNGR